MKRSHIALLIIGVGLLSGLIVFSELNPLKLFEVNVSVQVPSEENVIELKLDVRNSSGSVTYSNVSSLYLDRDVNVMFKLLSAEVNGDVKITLSGQVTLVSDDGIKYVVPMPCLFANNGCFRVLMLIPGYDTPMSLPRGKYSISLTLTWYGASGEGIIKLRVGLVEETVEVVKIGSRPENTTGWVTVEGSTKSYAVLVDPKAVKVGGCLYATHVWVWIFTPSNTTDVKNVKVVVEDLYSGKQLYNADVDLDKSGIYREALMKVILPQGKYILKIFITPETALQTTLSVETC
ncbi:MAG: hypothetical protein B7O98_04385 [Zestosphaera tikiterensis]|uniref:Uncharacterized protein n=1 Tax=Zestosphaera tikiterensis TaxID=1973259 RepID=A0A2R7Y810_9CREN|nr:MAG: hypothetical protein B7O98_04385 [Zestosphaera tikiterensis]